MLSAKADCLLRQVSLEFFESFPFVSGTRAGTNKNPATQMPAYVQNVPEEPSVRFKTGNVKVRTKDAIHNAETDMETPMPRTRLGKISEIITQVTGASGTA